MLTPIDTSVEATTTTPQADKTIALQHYGSAATLIYTVPEGRVFTGHFWNAAGGSVDAGYIVTGGGSVTNSTNGTYSTQSTWPPYSGQYPDYRTVLTVRAGDKLYSSTNANTRIRIMGVESDA
nr:hypothetical protein [uncultured Mediterranean phage uvMED]